MELKKLFKKLLNSACIIFTVSTALYMLAMLIMHVGDDDASLEVGRVLLIFVFSLLLAIANTLLSIERIHSTLRYILHYVITTFGFWVCFCIPNAMTASQTLVGIVIFSIVYAIIMTVVGIFARRLKKAQAKEQKYEKQFSVKKR
jgi:uncharacterized membrane protein YhaH (DUF805 family)